MNKLPQDDTITAVATPSGEGGIGIVRMSGPESLKIADRIFLSSDGKKPSGYPTYTAHYGHIVDPRRIDKKGSGGMKRAMKARKAGIVDEVILTVMRKPKSYTREDVVEINCHGGIQAVKKVLDLAIRNGSRLALPGEFTKRAFLNGRIDLAQAEAVLEVIRSKTEGSLKVAMGQLDGALSASVNDLREKVLDMASRIEASIDFPEEDIEPFERGGLAKTASGVIRQLKRLVSTYDAGSILREGVLGIICGKPNVGKSSLMNLLLRRDRVIVSPIPGTTRDAVEEMINIRGIPIRIVDTAGITDTKDVLEKEGVTVSRRYLGLADIVILVLDHSTGIDEADKSIMEMTKDKKRIIVINKCDIPSGSAKKLQGSLSCGEDLIRISVKKRINIDRLEKMIADKIWSGGFDQGEMGMVSSLRHKELLDKALVDMLSVKKALERGTPPELLAIDLRQAVYDLGLIVGRSVSDDILDKIFEKFCIGK